MNNSRTLATEKKLKALSEQAPMTVEEFIKQIEDGSADQRNMLRRIVSPRITSSTPSEEKLEIARTCVAAQFDYMRKDEDCPPEDFVAMYQLSMLLPYVNSWEDLKQRISMYNDL